MATHEGRIESEQTDTGVRFRAACTCGWTSIWRPTNQCMGNWRRHKAAATRRTRLMTAHIEVREPTDEYVGCVSARAIEFGPELCWAVGEKFGDWYVTMNESLWVAAGLEPQRTYVSGGRDGAENLVRLLAALYVRAVSA